MSRTSLLAFCLLSASACKPDAPAAVSTASPQGRWVVTGATRGGRPTNTLDAAYFEFDTARATLTTNFTGQEEVLHYTADATGFTLPEGELYQRIDLARLTDSTLAIATEIRGTRFTFALRPEATSPSMSTIEPVAADTFDAPLDDDPGER